MNELLEHKIAQFERALATLENGLRPQLNDLEIDGAIQRFEYCFELAWKSLKLHLEQVGLSGISSPKAVIQKGFIASIVTDEDQWLKILDDRNLSVHTYDEKNARAIFLRLPGHLTAFRMLLDEIKRDS